MCCWVFRVLLSVSCVAERVLLFPLAVPDDGQQDSVGADADSRGGGQRRRPYLPGTQPQYRRPGHAHHRRPPSYL